MAVLPDWLNQYSCIDASIATSCPSLTVQKCGLCHYIASLSDNWGVSFVNWWLIIEKEISKIVMLKQEPVELEAVRRKFNLKDSKHPLIPCLKSRQNELWNNLSSACTAAFITFELFLLSYWYVIHPIFFCHQRRSCVQARLGYSPVKLFFFFFNSPIPSPV